LGLFGTNDFANATFGLDFGFSRSAECMGAHGELFGKLTFAEDFNSMTAAIGQADGAQDVFVHPGAVIETVESLEVDGQITGRMAGIVKTSFRDTPYQWHLAALEADTDRTAGASGLAFATAPAGFSVTAGFALAQALATVLSAGARFQIM
jgi:hypothetical protein